MIRRRVVVRGLVQGVGFRDSVRRMARTVGVAGWVRNRGDGAVEGVFEGDPDSVRALVSWCGRGPRGAEVDTVDEVEEPAEGLVSFVVR